VLPSARRAKHSRRCRPGFSGARPPGTVGGRRQHHPRACVPGRHELHTPLAVSLPPARPGDEAHAPDPPRALAGARRRAPHRPAPPRPLPLGRLPHHQLAASPTGRRDARRPARSATSTRGTSSRTSRPTSSTSARTHSTGSRSPTGVPDGTRFRSRGGRPSRGWTRSSDPSTEVGTGRGWRRHRPLPSHRPKPRALRHPSDVGTAW
jgi:hypothetical protein